MSLHTMDDLRPEPQTVAVIGAGVAGAACADGLRRAGLAVTLFDKARAEGGRLAARSFAWLDETGDEQSLALDLGASCFTARLPRFRGVVARACAAGAVAPWAPRVHSSRPGRQTLDAFVGMPDMPALVRHLAGALPFARGVTVRRLQRNGGAGGRGRWSLVTAEAGVVDGFDAVLLAVPPAQSALLLAGLHDAWADELASLPMAPCWTLSAVTDDVEWPWDLVEPDRGPLGWVVRHERKPGRTAPPGTASWVAQATTSWSAARLEADPAGVCEQLRAALVALVPGGRIGRWHHAAVHRWRAAVPLRPKPDERDCWWDGELGLGVCSDALAGADVEAAWHSGDELADTVAACLDDRLEPAETRSR